MDSASHKLSSRAFVRIGSWASSGKRPPAMFFDLRNIGRTDITVVEVLTDCGCASTGVDSPLLILPGSRKRIRLEWTPSPEPPKQQRSAQVKYLEDDELKIGMLVFRCELAETAAGTREFLFP